MTLAKQEVDGYCSCGVAGALKAARRLAKMKAPRTADTAKRQRRGCTDMACQTAGE